MSYVGISLVFSTQSCLAQKQPGAGSTKFSKIIIYQRIQEHVAMSSVWLPLSMCWLPFYCFHPLHNWPLHTISWFTNPQNCRIHLLTKFLTIKLCQLEKDLCHMCYQSNDCIIINFFGNSWNIKIYIGKETIYSLHNLSSGTYICLQQNHFLIVLIYSLNSYPCENLLMLGYFKYTIKFWYKMLGWNLQWMPVICCGGNWQICKSGFCHSWSFCHCKFLHSV